MSVKSDNKASTQGNRTIADYVESVLKVARTRPVSVGKEHGYFLSETRVEVLQDRLLDAMEGTAGTSASNATLIELHDQLSTLKNEKLVAETAHLASKKDLALLRQDLKSAQVALGAIEAKTRQDESEVKAVQTKLRSELDLAKKALADVKGKVWKAGKGTDVELAEKLSHEKILLQAELKSLNEDLNKANVLQGKLVKERSTAQAEVKALAADLAISKAQAEASKAVASAKDLKAVPVGPVQVELSPTILKLLGEKGKSWLLQAEEVAKNDARDRAFKLMMACSTNTTKTFQGLKGILEIAFKWCKEQSFKVREKIIPWIDMIENDIRKMTLKSLKFYREKLEEVITSLKKSKDKAKAKWERDAKPRFQSLKVKIYVWYISTRAYLKVKAKRYWNDLKDILGKVKIFKSAKENKGKSKDLTPNEVLFESEKAESVLNERRASRWPSA